MRGKKLQKDRWGDEKKQGKGNERIGEKDVRRRYKEKRKEEGRQRVEFTTRVHSIKLTFTVLCYVLFFP